jgi:hypothetical protein
MGHRRPFSEEKINARLREVTAELRKLRQELQEDLRGHRRAPRPFTRIHDGEVGTAGSGRTRER